VVEIKGGRGGGHFVGVFGGFLVGCAR